MLSKGDEGAAVATLQAKLNELGYGLAIDGIFGRNTKAAVCHLQDAAELDVDGIVGPKTRRALDALVDESWRADDYDAEEWYDEDEESEDEESEDEESEDEESEEDED